MFGSALLLAEMITDRDGSCRRPITSELVGEIRHIVQVELGADEETLLDRYLDADSKVDLEMRRTADGRGVIAAHRNPHTGILVENETRRRGADSALQLQDSALIDDGLIDAIHIDKRLPGSEGPVILMHRLEVHFRSNAEMLTEHDVSSEPKEKAAEAGRGLAKRVSRARYASP